MGVINSLSLVAGGTGFWTAFTEGRKAGALGIGFIVGLGVGFICFWVMRAMVKGVVQRPGRGQQNSPAFGILGWLFGMGLFAWIILSGFFGTWVTQCVIKLCR